MPQMYYSSVSGYEFMKNIILFSAFYSLIVTLLSYAVIVPNEFVPEKNINDIRGLTENVYKNSIGIPIIDLGALVFFTGNAFLDFLINFVTAVPSAAVAVLGFAFMFTNLPADIINTVKTSIFAVGIVLYVITLIAIILNIRSRGAVL
jgi:hypothetical protein